MGQEAPGTTIEFVLRGNTMNIGPVLKYPGSKWRMSDWIVSYLPKHGTYLEPFFGSGAVFFTKKPARVETINDVDKHIVNFFKVLREQPDELARVVELTPWSRLEYEEYMTSAKEKDYFLQSDNPVENARRLLIRMNMGHGSRTSDMGGGDTMSNQRLVIHHQRFGKAYLKGFI